MAKRYTLLYNLSLNVSKHLETCTLLDRLVRRNLSMVQAVLASEGISLEFRLITSYLLWYCQCHSETILLNQVF